MNYGLRHGTVLKLTSGSSSSASSAFSANISYIRVVGTIACHIHIAVSPTATKTSMTSTSSNSPRSGTRNCTVSATIYSPSIKHLNQQVFCLDKL